jgi:hypothetical protein
VPGKRPKWIWLVIPPSLIVLGLAAILAGAAGPSPGDATVADLLSKGDQCRANVQQLGREGLKVSRMARHTDATIAEAAWEALTYDEKVKEALLIFCAEMPPSGRYSVFVINAHNGQVMASVVDGNYYDAFFYEDPRVSAMCGPETPLR